MPFLDHQQQALEIYRKLNRPDLTRQLKEKFAADGACLGKAPQSIHLAP